jgi:hypothetical protein
MRTETIPRGSPRMNAADIAVALDLGYTGEICSITMLAGVKDPCDLQVQLPANPPISLVPKRPSTDGEGSR